jgi:ABC-2 type transport system permease protein
MRKIRVIAVREYVTAVRTKSFLISLVFVPLLMLGSAGVQVLIDNLAEGTDRHFAVIDRTPGQKLYHALDAAVRVHNQTEVRDPEMRKQARTQFVITPVAPSSAMPEAIRAQRFELSEQVRQGRLTGFLDIGGDVLDIPAEPLRPGASPPDVVSVRYQSNSPTQDAFARWAERVINAAVIGERCQKEGLQPRKVALLVQPVPLRIKGLVRRDPATGAIEDVSDEGRAATFLVPAALTMLMFLVVMVGATPLMQGVIEEKMQRIAEVLLGSVRPFELMMGKLLGMLAVSLSLATVYLAGAYWVLNRYGFTEYLSGELLAWFLVFQVLAVLMYGSLFIAIGAACSDAKETQTLMIPVVMLITFPLFTLRHVIQEPNSAFSFWTSLFPFGTPMLMVTRLGLPPGIPWWQPALGVVGVLATTLVCVYAAGRIFRVGILMQGKGAKLHDLARWVFRG